MRSDRLQQEENSLKLQTGLQAIVHSPSIPVKCNTRPLEQQGNDQHWQSQGMFVHDTQHVHKYVFLCVVGKQFANAGRTL